MEQPGFRPLVYIAGAALFISGLIVAGYFYLAPREAEVRQFLDSNNVVNEAGFRAYVVPVVYTVLGLLFAAVLVSFFFKGAALMKERQKLKTTGSRVYCPVDKVENVKYHSKHGIIEYKKVYARTPLGKSGIYDLSIETDVVEGDSILIMFDSANPDSYLLVWENGNAVIKKKQI
jgi:hypothetical protein